jgi:uncharacterized membrane protein
MTLLRIVLIAVLLYYGIKLLASWIFRSNGERVHGKRRNRANGVKQRYRDLTDQQIEDADYEEIDREEKP